MHPTLNERKGNFHNLRPCAITPPIICLLVQHLPLHPTTRYALGGSHIPIYNPTITIVKSTFVTINIYINPLFFLVSLTLNKKQTNADFEKANRNKRLHPVEPFYQGEFLSARGGNVVFVVAFSVEDFAGYEAETDEVGDGAEDRLEVVAAKVAHETAADDDAEGGWRA